MSIFDLLFLLAVLASVVTVAFATVSPFEAVVRRHSRFSASTAFVPLCISWSGLRLRS